MSASKKKFKTEVQQLLELVIHSLYTKKEIFLRELISNASDAVDRLKFEALSDKSLLDGDDEFKIQLIPDTDKNTLTIVDNGIGMSREEVEQHIGTIASSGTRAFLDELKKGKDQEHPEMIGRFGIGFYSGFMVADKVTMQTLRAGKDQVPVKWSSAGAGTFTIDDGDKSSRGTEITLHLREDMGEYLEEWRLRKIVTQYSDYVSYPVSMDITREEVPRDEEGKAIEGEDPIVTIEEQTLNSMKAIWRRSKSEITDDEYNEFYNHVTHDYTDPRKVVHYNAEGKTEFTALLFLPSKPPFDMYFQAEYKGLQLYVRNVMITDDCKELVPEYLRYVRGVVDSSDLPLNVSRETLQDEAGIRLISKSLVSKMLSILTEMKEKTPDDYRDFWTDFGKVLKEGMHTDFSNREKLQELIIFESSKTEPGQYVSLKEYVDRAPSEQEEIYYITGENRRVVENSPHLEVFKSKDYEVLFMTDPIDEFVTQGLTEYDGKAIKPVDRGEIDFDSEDEKEEKEDAKKESEEKYKDLIEHVQGKYDEQLNKVRLSNRLTDSPACLVADEHAMNAHVERMYRAMNQDVPVQKRTLELNPEHPIIDIMLSLKGQDDERLDDYCCLLYDQALLTEGSPIENPLRFAQLVTDLMVKSA